MIIDAELDVCPSYGWQGGPEFNTLIKQLRSGHERRRPLWGQVKHRYTLPFENITDAAYLSQLKSAYLAAMGSAHSFWVKDWSDFRAENAVFGSGNGVDDEFEVGVQSTFGPASYFRRVLRVSPDSVFMVNGSPVAATFNPATGRVVFDSPPADLSSLTWTGEFRVLVRFASDAFPMTIDNRMSEGYAMNGSVELMEVWE